MTPNLIADGEGGRDGGAEMAACCAGADADDMLRRAEILAGQMEEAAAARRRRRIRKGRSKGRKNRPRGCGGGDDADGKNAPAPAEGEFSSGAPSTVPPSRPPEECHRPAPPVENCEGGSSTPAAAAAMTTTTTKEDISSACSPPLGPVAALPAPAVARLRPSSSASASADENGGKGGEVAEARLHAERAEENARIMREALASLEAGSTVDPADAIGRAAGEDSGDEDELLGDTFVPSSNGGMGRGDGDDGTDVSSLHMHNSGFVGAWGGGNGGNSGGSDPFCDMSSIGSQSAFSALSNQASWQGGAMRHPSPRQLSPSPRVALPEVVRRGSLTGMAPPPPPLLPPLSPSKRGGGAAAARANPPQGRDDMSADTERRMAEYLHVRTEAMRALASSVVEGEENPTAASSSSPCPPPLAATGDAVEDAAGELPPPRSSALEIGDREGGDEALRRLLEDDVLAEAAAVLGGGGDGGSPPIGGRDGGVRMFAFGEGPSSLVAAAAAASSSSPPPAPAGVAPCAADVDRMIAEAEASVRSGASGARLSTAPQVMVGTSSLEGTDGRAVDVGVEASPPPAAAVGPSAESAGLLVDVDAALERTRRMMEDARSAMAEGAAGASDTEAEEDEFEDAPSGDDSGGISEDFEGDQGIYPADEPDELGPYDPPPALENEEEDGDGDVDGDDDDCFDGASIPRAIRCSPAASDAVSAMGASVMDPPGHGYGVGADDDSYVPVSDFTRTKTRTRRYAPLGSAAAVAATSESILRYREEVRRRRRRRRKRRRRMVAVAAALLCAVLLVIYCRRRGVGGGAGGDADERDGNGAVEGSRTDGGDDLVRNTDPDDAVEGEDEGDDAVLDADSDDAVEEENEGNDVVRDADSNNADEDEIDNVFREADSSDAVEDEGDDVVRDSNSNDADDGNDVVRDGDSNDGDKDEDEEFGDEGDSGSRIFNEEEDIRGRDSDGDFTGAEDLEETMEDEDESDEGNRGTEGTSPDSAATIDGALTGEGATIEFGHDDIDNDTGLTPGKPGDGDSSGRDGLISRGGELAGSAAGICEAGDLRSCDVDGDTSGDSWRPVASSSSPPASEPLREEIESVGGSSLNVAIPSLMEIGVRADAKSDAEKNGELHVVSVRSFPDSDEDATDVIPTVVKPTSTADEPDPLVEITSAADDQWRRQEISRTMEGEKKAQPSCTGPFALLSGECRRRRREEREALDESKGEQTRPSMMETAHEQKPQKNSILTGLFAGSGLAHLEGGRLATEVGSKENERVGGREKVKLPCSGPFARFSGNCRRQRRQQEPGK